MSDQAPDRDMSGHGWKKKLTWKYIKEEEDGTYTVAEVDFETGGLIRCEACKTSDYIWLVPQRVGVFMACTGCNTSDGPITREAGEVIKIYKIPPAEAARIMDARGERVTPKLRKLAGRVQSNIRKGDRPKDVY